MASLPTLAALTCLVEVGGRSEDPVDRVVAAEALAVELTSLADRLVGYFVEKARVDGCSWADLGDRVGVSRQAAQQRYTPRIESLTISDLRAAGRLTHFTRRASDALFAAEAGARARGAASVEAPDLLEALMTTDNVAVDAVRALGARAAVVRRKSPAGRGAGRSSKGDLPVNSDARRALVGALDEALAMGHNYIGTEHLLLGLLRDDNPTSQVLAEHGVTLPAARNAVRDRLNELLRSRS